MNARVLVTGGSGFIGGVLCRTLTSKGYRVRAAVRDAFATTGADENVVVGHIGARTDWSRVLRDIELVVHAAGTTDDGTRRDAPPFEAEVAATEALALACAGARVRRFVFLSSVKVNGEESSGQAFRSSDAPDPQDAYARAKWSAEQVIGRVAINQSLNHAIVRAPLVYGAGVRANFLRLLRWIARGYPLPVGAIRNRRSLVSVWNLADLIERMLVSPAASGRVWMVSDGEDLSTAELACRIAAAMQRRARIVPVPEGMLRWAGKLMGRNKEIARLCGTLQVDVSQTVASLGWSPPLGIDAGLSRTVRWFGSKG